MTHVHRLARRLAVPTTLVALSACSSEPLLLPPLDMTQSAVAFPADAEWKAIQQGNAVMGDITTDGTDSQGREIIGDAGNPAVQVFMGATHYFVRLRLSESPLTMQGDLGSFGWGLLLDTDGDLNDYEFSIFVDGIRDEVSFQQNTTQ